MGRSLFSFFSSGPLFDMAECSALYDLKYEHEGYMDFWDTRTMDRVRRVLNSVHLEGGSYILDYGCGTGVFSEVLRHCFPDCHVHGCDIASSAIHSARLRHPSVEFYRLDRDSVRRHSGTYDLLFTHHVLEHVADLESVGDEISRLCKPKSVLIHALPCRNQGSLEHWLCTLREDGFRSAGRFYFEDPSHLRRLNAEELDVLFRKRGFHLKEQFYNNHFWGALEWLSRTRLKNIRRVLDPAAARPPERWKIVGLQNVLLALALARMPAQIPTITARVLRQRLVYRNRRQSFGKLATMIGVTFFVLPLAVPSWVVDYMMQARARREWNDFMRVPSGSEMYLVFTRGDGAT